VKVSNFDKLFFFGSMSLNCIFLALLSLPMVLHSLYPPLSATEAQTIIVQVRPFLHYTTIFRPSMTQLRRFESHVLQCSNISIDGELLCLLEDAPDNPSRSSTVVYFYTQRFGIPNRTRLNGTQRLLQLQKQADTVLYKKYCAWFKGEDSKFRFFDAQWVPLIQSVWHL
jgi:hypothetical protein